MLVIAPVWITPANTCMCPNSHCWKFPVVQNFKSWHSCWIADISQEQCKIVVVLHSSKFSHIWPNLIWNFCKCPWSKWLLHWQVYSIVLLKRSMEHFLFSFLSEGKNNECTYNMKRVLKIFFFILNRQKRF